MFEWMCMQWEVLVPLGDMRDEEAVASQCGLQNE